MQHCRGLRQCHSRALTLACQMDYNVPIKWTAVFSTARRFGGNMVERLPRLQESAPSIKTTVGSSRRGGGMEKRVLV